MIANLLVSQLKKYNLKSELYILLEEESLRPLKLKSITPENGRIKMVLEKSSIENKPEPTPVVEQVVEQVEEPTVVKNPLLVDEEEDGE